MSAAAETRALHGVARALLAEAAEWRLIGLLLERPHGDWWRQVAALSAEVGDAQLQAAAQAAGAAGEGDYLAVLGPGRSVSPREVAHLPLAQPGLLLGDVAAFYDAFAYRPALLEPLDHVAIEVGFLSFLRLKQAYALAHGEGECAEVTAAAATRFLAEHLRPLAAAVAHGLHASEVEHLRLLASALARRVGPHRPRVLLSPEVGGDEAGCAFDALGPEPDPLLAPRA
jgi:hypothetical protein